MLAVVLLLLAGEALIRPAPKAVGPPPDDLGAATVRIPLATGGSLVAWRIRGREGAGAVLLLHGIRGDRRDMLGRARMLKAAGYSVLLPDLPAHGESTGEHITFGAREAEGARASLRFLRETFPGERTAVIGVSLGAAALALARPVPAPDAVILESLYTTLRQATENRLSLHFGEAGRHLAPLLLWQLPLRLDIRHEQLRPVEAVGHLATPMLIAFGTRDRHATPEEAQTLAAAAAPHAELWPVAGAGHEDLHRFNPPAYEARIMRFLERHLRPNAPSGLRGVPGAPLPIGTRPHHYRDRVSAPKETRIRHSQGRSELA